MTETVQSAIHSDLEKAIAFHQSGRLDDALYLYTQYLQVHSRDDVGWKLLSAVYHHKNNVEKALLAIRRAISINPLNPDCYAICGVYLMTVERWQEAIDAFQAVLRLKPRDAETFAKLGVVYRNCGQPDQAERCYRRALDIEPTYQVMSNLGTLLMYQGRLDEAESFLLRAYEMKPDHYYILTNLGAVYGFKNRYRDAERFLRECLKRKPDHAEAIYSLGSVLSSQGFHEEAHNYLQKVFTANPTFSTQGSALMTWQYSSYVTSDELASKAFDWGRQASASCPKRSHANHDCNPERPLKIGYVSADFHNHPVGYFFEHVAREHDRERYPITCYSTFHQEDALTFRLKKSVSRWVSAGNYTDEQLTEAIVKDEIDILIDLSGHTAKNRLLAFARKPAPVQASWLGYFATTGLPEIDYIIGDRFVTPEDEEHHYSEHVVRMPHSYLCFTPPDIEIAIDPEPHSDGEVVFGSFNKIAKLYDEVIDAWAETLKAVPGSRLLMKTAALSEKSVCERLAAKFAERGIERERLEFEGNSPRAQLLKTYNRVDIALDSFPYNGGTTTVEALWMGVPVVSMSGDRFVSHVGESILNALGEPGWVARNRSEFVKIARDLAENNSYRNELRTTLRQRLLNSPLCDAKTFTRDLETLYRRLWHDYCAQESLSQDGAA